MPTARVVNNPLPMSQFSTVDKKEEEEERAPWPFETYIFWKRRKENESCSVFDSDQVSANSCLQEAGPLAPLCHLGLLLYSGSTVYEVYFLISGPG